MTKIRKRARAFVEWAEANHDELYMLTYDGEE